MVKFGLKTSAEAREESEKWRELKGDIESLRKFEVALRIYEILAKHPEVQTWGVRVEKDYYNDDGLYEGAYADYTTDEKPYLCPEEDEYEYPEDQTTIHRDINKALSEYHQDATGGNSGVFPHLVYPNGLRGLESFISDFVGKEYAAKWKAGVEGVDLEAGVRKAKRGSPKKEVGSL